MSDDLKPCPFCGYDKIQITADENQGYKWGRAVCICCNAVGPEVRTGYDKSFEAPWRAEAKAEWNRRASDAEIERLRAVLQNLTTKMGAQKAVTGREFSITVEVALRSARAALSPLTAKENKP